MMIGQIYQSNRRAVVETVRAAALRSEERLAGATLTSEDRSLNAEDCTVLIVDDEPNIVEVVSAYLQRELYKVVTAADGEEALRMISQHAPDLIVLDVMLPKLDGLEVCRRVRATSQVPIVMLTAKDEESDKVLGLGLGADDYIAKPFSPRELVARVQAVLRRARTSPPAPGDQLRYGNLK